jgi:hypothetical protein
MSLLGIRICKELPDRLLSRFGSFRWTLWRRFGDLDFKSRLGRFHRRKNRSSCQVHRVNPEAGAQNGTEDLIDLKAVQHGGTSRSLWQQFAHSSRPNRMFNAQAGNKLPKAIIKLL